MGLTTVSLGTHVDVTGLASRLRVLVGHLARRLRAESDPNQVTLMQSAVLSRLAAEGPTTPSALARAEHVRPQSMSTALDAMVEVGLVRKTAHPTDGRQLLVSLTAKGRRKLAAERASRQAWLARAIVEELTPDEQRRLVDAIDLLERLARRT